MNSKQKFKINANPELAQKFKFLLEMITNLGKAVETDHETSIELINAWQEQSKAYQEQYASLAKQTFNYLQREVEYAKLSKPNDNTDAKTKEPPSLT